MPDTNKTITASEAVKAASAAPVKPAAVAAGENKAPNAAPAKPASVSNSAAAAPTGADKQAVVHVQPKSPAAPKVSPSASSKPAPVAEQKVSASALAAPASKPTGTGKPAAAQSLPKVGVVPPTKHVAQDKKNLPSASTGNKVQKKDSKLVPKQEGKLVIPDLILIAHPVVTTVEKITSRLSPGMKLVLFYLLVPTFLSLIYFGLWASPMYIAEARFAVRGAENGAIETGGLASMLLPAS